MSRAGKIIFFCLCFAVTSALYVVEFGAGFFEPEYTFSFNIPQKFNATYVCYSSTSMGNVRGEHKDHALPYAATGQAKSGVALDLFVRYFIDTQETISGENVDPLPQLKEVGEKTKFVFEVDGRGDPVYLLGQKWLAPVVWICVDAVISVIVFGVIYFLFFSPSEEAGS
jgi:hypothetical protein